MDYEEHNVTVYRPNQNTNVLREGGELTGGDDQVADIFKLTGEWAVTPPPQAPLA